jgi:thioesterase domain-containing protein
MMPEEFSDLLPDYTEAPKLLQDYLAHSIPQVAHMQATVTSLDDDGLFLYAPLEPNRNHIGTVFGGSLNSLATLSAWGLIWLLLRGRDASIVIQDGSMKFQRPAREDFTARCPLPPLPLLQDFIQQYEKNGHARLTLNAQVLCRNRKVAEFEGRFVARKPKKK